MVGRQPAAVVLQQEAQVDVVARPPDAALAPEETLEPALDRFATRVEVADRQCLATAELEVADVLAALRGEDEGRASGVVHGDLREALAVGLALGELLVLVVAHRELHAGQRLAAVDGGRGEVQLAVGAALGDQAEVGSEEVALGLHALVPAVVGGLAGIVALAPVGVLLVVVALLAAVPAAVAGLVVAGERRLGFGRGRRARAVVGGVGAGDGDAQPVQRARLAADEFAGVEQVAVPAVGLAGGQGERLAPEIAADAVQLVAAVEVVDLQELRDVVLVDLEGGDAHGSRVHHLDGDSQLGAVGQDHALAREAHLRPLVGEGERGVVVLAQRLAAAAAQFGADGEPHLAADRLAGIHRQLRALDAAGEAAGAQADQRVELLLRVERFGEAQAQGLAAFGERGGVEHAEGAQRRHFQISRALALQAQRRAVPAQAHQALVVAARDALGAEVVQTAAFDVQPLQRELLLAVLCLQQLLDLGRILAVGSLQLAAQFQLGAVATGGGDEAGLADLEVRRQALEGELVGREVLRHAEQALGAELRAVLLVGLQRRAVLPDDLARAGVARRAVETGLHLQHVGGALADLRGCDHVVTEAQAQRRRTRQGASAVLGQMLAPGRIGLRGRGHRSWGRRALAGRDQGGGGEDQPDSLAAGAMRGHGGLRPPVRAAMWQCAAAPANGAIRCRQRPIRCELTLSSSAKRLIPETKTNLNEPSSINP